VAAGSTAPLSQDAASVSRKSTRLGVRNLRRSARTAPGGTAPQHRLSDPARGVLRTDDDIAGVVDFDPMRNLRSRTTQTERQIAAPGIGQVANDADVDAIAPGQLRYRVHLDSSGVQG